MHLDRGAVGPVQLTKVEIEIAHGGHEADGYVDEPEAE